MSGNGLPNHPQQGHIIGWQPVYAGPLKPPVSGIRIATGIITIVASLWAALFILLQMSQWDDLESLVMYSILGLISSTLPFILGIIQLATSRSTHLGIPGTLCFLNAAGVMLSGAYVYLEYPYAIVAAVSALFSLVIVVLTGVTINREMRKDSLARRAATRPATGTPDLPSRKLPKLK